jgi:hypothetical protein
MICLLWADHFKNVGKQPLQQSGKYRVNENDEEIFVRFPQASVITGHSRSKNGVAFARLCPVIHVLSHGYVLRRGCPASQTSPRSLRTADYYGRA